MRTAINNPSDTVLLYDVPWEAYERLLEAKGERRLRHTYQDGTLELFQNIVEGVSWSDYEKILAAFGDRRFHHTYQNGVLEMMMSPSEEHEQIKRLLGRLIEMASLETRMRIRSTGSATRRNKRTKNGLEPDESYFFEQGSLVGRKRGLNIRQEPAPDLAVEVDLRSPALDRLESYAMLGVRELWRYHKGKVAFFLLSEDLTYRAVEKSYAFPEIASKDMTRFVKQLTKTDENSIVRGFVAWLRERQKKS